MVLSLNIYATTAWVALRLIFSKDEICKRRPLSTTLKSKAQRVDVERGFI